MIGVPETRFARTASGASIAYQVVGDGAITITSVPPMAQNIELAWEWPAIRRLFEGISSFARFVMFDKRGTGMSDRSLDIPGLDERVDELVAVLDDAGIERTYLMGTSEGGPMTLMFAATYPERVDGVILEATAATLVSDDQRDEIARNGPSAESTELRHRFVDGWGTTASIVPDLFAPTLAGDQEYRRWHQRYERNSASRDALVALFDLNGKLDARGVLHRIECPVLMINRTDDRMLPIELARETEGLLASYGVEVELLELPGADHFVYAGDLMPVLQAIERFTTGSSGAVHPHRISRRNEVITLGRFEVSVAGEPVPTASWGSKRARTLLKRLVAARGWPVPREELVELLWPEGGDPDRLGARLSVQLSTVRRILHGGVIADRSSIRLDLDQVDVDLERWFAETDDATIVATYTGEFLPDDRYDDWTRPLRDEVRARFVGAARRVAADRTGEAAAELWRRILADDPYDVAAHHGLVATLRHDRRLGEARNAYQSYVGAMQDLGVDADPWDRLA